MLTNKSYSKYKCMSCDFWYDRYCGGGYSTDGINPTMSMYNKICPICREKKDEEERRVIRQQLN